MMERTTFHGPRSNVVPLFGPGRMGKAHTPLRLDVTDFAWMWAGAPLLLISFAGVLDIGRLMALAAAERVANPFLFGEHS